MSIGNQATMGAATTGSEDSTLLRARVQALEATVAHVTKLLRLTQESCMVWEQTFNAVSDPIAVISSDYHVLRANAAYQRLLATSPHHGDQHICFEAEGQTCAHCPLAETLLSRRPGHMRHELVVSDAPDEERCAQTLERWTYPVMNADGTVDRVVEIVKDVTEEVRLHEVMSAAEGLRQADHLKAELLGTVSHELRSPLAAIQGYAETLLRHEKRLASGERHEFLAAIQDASERLNAIVDRMLELSELETGSYPFRWESVDLARTARDALVALRLPHENEVDKTLSFALRLEDEQLQPTDMLPLVRGDARLLRDLLDHLIENAIKYSPTGGTIAITLRASEFDSLLRRKVQAARATAAAHGEVPLPAGDKADAVRMLEVIVEDHGLGIPAEHLPKVFERFHQVDSGLTRNAGGLGLGLAVCQRITELHHGIIWAESDPGQGSAFHVLLPLAPGAE
jgi:signal transduction histidine kinase